MLSNKAHKIEIVVAPDGTLTSTVKGIAGPSCKGIEQWLQTLGQITDAAPTDDYYKPDEQGVNLSAGAE